MIGIIYVVSDQDYEAQTEDLIFPTGTTTAYLSLGNLDNINNEDLESFSANLSSPTNGLSLGMNVTATVYIMDDDCKLYSCTISQI